MTDCASLRPSSTLIPIQIGGLALVSCCLLQCGPDSKRPAEEMEIPAETQSGAITCDVAQVVVPSVKAYALTVADDRVYWSQWMDDPFNDAIMFLSLDTGEIGALVENVPEPTQITVDDGHVYWTSGFGGTVNRIDPSGIGPVQELVQGASRPSGIVLDATHAYWSDFFAGTINRIDKETGVSEIIGHSPDSPSDMLIVDDSLFWVDPNGRAVLKMPISGGQTTELFVGEGYPHGLVRRADHIYLMVLQGPILRSDLDLSMESLEVLLDAAPSTGTIAATTSHLIWTHPMAGLVKAMPFDSTDTYELAGVDWPYSVAVSTRCLFWATVEGHVGPSEPSIWAAPLPD